MGLGYIGSFSRVDSSIRWSRHVVGVRLVASRTISFDRPNESSTTFGIEVEPLGVLQKAFGRNHD